MKSFIPFFSAFFVFSFSFGQQKVIQEGDIAVAILNEENFSFQNASITLSQSDNFVFDNAPGMPLTGNGFIMKTIDWYDDFSLESSIEITGAQIEWFENPSSSTPITWDGTIEWAIYADNANSPSDLIAQGLGSEVSTTSFPLITQTIFSTEFLFDNPVDLEGGVKYWFTVNFYSGCPSQQLPETLIVWQYYMDPQDDTVLPHYDIGCIGSPEIPGFINEGRRLSFRLLGTTQPIPTFSRWAIIALGMLTMIFGVVNLKYSTRPRLQGR